MSIGNMVYGILAVWCRCVAWRTAENAPLCAKAPKNPVTTSANQMARPGSRLRAAPGLPRPQNPPEMMRFKGRPPVMLVAM
jgi:hypothetical protein